MPFKHRFFFFFAFLAVFTAVQYFSDQHKLKGGFTLLGKSLVLGSAGGEPAETPALGTGLRTACFWRCLNGPCWGVLSVFRVSKLLVVANLFIVLFHAILLALYSLEYHKLFHKSQAHKKFFCIPSPNTAIWAQHVHEISQLNIVSGHACLCHQCDVCAHHSMFNKCCSAVLNKAPPWHRLFNVSKKILSLLQKMVCRKENTELQLMVREEQMIHISEKQGWNSWLCKLLTCNSIIQKHTCLCSS